MARKTRSEASLDKVLGEIQELKARERMIQENDWAVRKGHLGPTQLGDRPTAEAIAAAQGRQDYLDQCEADLELLASKIREKWELAAGLSDGGERLAGSDQEIEAQHAALVEQRRRLDRLAGTFREDKHAAVDAVVADHRDRIAALLNSPLGAGEMVDVAGLWAWRDPAFAEALHAAVDARPDSEFAAGARSSWQAELQTLARRINRRQKELALREQERTAAEAEARRAQAEVELAAIES